MKIVCPPLHSLHRSAIGGMLALLMLWVGLAQSPACGASFECGQMAAMCDCIPLRGDDDTGSAMGMAGFCAAVCKPVTIAVHPAPLPLPGLPDRFELVSGTWPVGRGQPPDVPVPRTGRMPEQPLINPMET